MDAAFAETLARRGLNLILIAREKERLEAAAKKLRERYSIDVLTITSDLADYEKIKHLIEARLSEDNKKYSIGLMVYNAAYAPIGLIENTSEEQLSVTAAVNVRTPLLLTKLLSAPMINNKRGGIVLMSSLACAHGSSMPAVYEASKAFNTVLAEGLWKELKANGVDVISCCAGVISAPAQQQTKKSRLPPGTLSANDIAEQTLKALGKGPIVIPGTINKLVYFVLTRLLTKKAAIDIISKNTGGLS